VAASKSAISRFVDSVDPFLDLWGGAEFRFSAARVGTHYYNLLSTGLLVPNLIQRRQVEVRIRDGILLAGSMKVPRDEVVSVTQSLASPEVQFGEFPIRLLSPPGGQSGTFDEGNLAPYSWNFQESDLTGTYAFAPRREGSQVFALYGWGTMFSQVAQGGDWVEIHRRLSAAGFLDFPDFARDFLGYQQQVGSTSTVGFQILAPLYTGITELSEPSKGLLRVRIQGPAFAKTQDFRLVAVRSKDAAEATIRGEHEVKAVASPAPGLGGFEADVDVSDCYETNLQLAIRGHVVDLKRWFRWTPASGNPNYAFLFALEEAESRLHRILEGKESKLAENGKLEIACSWILGLSGFVAMLTDLGGMKTVLKGQDSPDLVATFAAGRRALVVECTTGSIDDPEKLSKLSRRTRGLRDRRPDFEILPVAIAAGVEPNDTELRSAHAEGVAVLLLQDLVELLWFAKEGRSPHDVFDYVKSKVPA
jgi:hypothetical protein